MQFFKCLQLKDFNQQILIFFLLMSKLILHVKISAVFLAKAGNEIQVQIQECYKVLRLRQFLTLQTITQQFTYEKTFAKKVICCSLLLVSIECKPGSLVMGHGALGWTGTASVSRCIDIEIAQSSSERTKYTYFEVFFENIQR